MHQTSKNSATDARALNGPLIHKQPLRSVALLCAIPILSLISACQLAEQSNNTAQSEYYSFTYESAAEEQFVEGLLDAMTIEQKVGQMVQAEIKAATPEEAAKYALGSVLNGGGSFPDANMYASRSDWVDLANAYYQTPHKESTDTVQIPILWGTDAVHGHNNVFGAVIFPHNIGLGAADNAALTEEVYAATARDVRSTGIKWAFSPTVAVAQNLRWGRTYESFSENPEIVSRLGEAAVLGLQGRETRSVAEGNRVIATAKHFIGDGGTVSGIDQGDVVVDKERLLELHGKSFQRAIDAGVQTVMASFNSWHGEKVHGHHYLLTEVLKRDMGFNGFVIGDWDGHAQVDGCSRSSCAQSINAGVDMLMAPKDWKALIENTLSDIENGKIALSRIDDANRRILSVKYRAGLFDEGYRQQPVLEDSAIALINQEHRAIARRAVRESLVLLKNNNQALPIPADQRLLVVGDHADSIAALSGGWSLTWQGDGTTNLDFPNGQSIVSALKDVMVSNGGSVTLKSIEEIRPLIEDKQSFAQLVSDFDRVIMVYGEKPYAEGGGDVHELLLPNRILAYAEALEKLQAAELPTISLLVSGRPLSVNRYINASDAFVAVWLPGSEASGIADVIVGKRDGTPRYDFTGSLPFAWPGYASQEQFNSNELIAGDAPEAAESTQAQSKLPAQFALGYGLSYQNTAQLAALDVLDNQDPTLLVKNDMLPIFMKTVYEPWALYVGDEDNWSVGVDGNRGATQNRQTLTVHATDNQTQEDARKLSWSTEKYGQFYFQYQQGVDISKLANKNGALAFKVKVDTPPNNSVILRMDCHYPCAGQLDVAEFLRGLPANQWQDVAIDLSCFAEQGAQFSHINTPFLIGTSGKMSIEISDIMIATETPADQSIRCPRYTAQQANF